MDMNPIKFAQSVSEALGLKKSSAAEAIGDLSPRDAALQAKNRGHRAATFPTGYARSVRRQRQRDRARQQKREQRNYLRNQQARADFYDTAGPLAEIYFGTRPVRPETRAAIVSRVEGQARKVVADTLAADPKAKITFSTALAQVEAGMRDNVDQFHALCAQREERELRFRLGTKRGEAAVNARFAADELSREAQEMGLDDLRPVIG